MGFILSNLIGFYLKIRGINYSNTLYWKESSIFCDVYLVWSFHNEAVRKEYRIKIKETDIVICLSNILKIKAEIDKALI